MLNLNKESENCNLTPKEINDLLNTIKTSKSQTEIDSCKQKIAMANLKLIGHVMKPYNKFKTIPSDDLISEGVIGIYTAIDKFDPSKKARFSTYAFMWIKQKIQRYVEKNCMNKIDMSSQSIDKPCFCGDEDSKDLGEMLAAPSHEDREETEVMKALKTVLDSLSPRERVVVKARMGI